MALSTSTIIEINSAATAGNLNGGGFNYANANFITDYTATAANTASPVISSASYTFVAGDVGAWIYVLSGSNWTPGFYEIVSVTGGAATVDAAIGEALQVTGFQWRLNTVVGCATTASPSSGVCGIDYTRKTAAITNNTDLASTDGTTNPSTITSAGSPFGRNHVGNVIHITAGASWTAGWYEIVSVSGTTATLDRAVGSAASLSSGTFYLSGALSLAAANDDAVFELAVTSSTYSTIFYIKGNATYTLGGTVSTGVTGTTISPLMIIGYDSKRGDNPTSTNRPLINCGANAISFANSWWCLYLRFTGTAANVIAAGGFNNFIFCNVVNTSTTAGRGGINVQGSNLIFGCECISYRGSALNIQGAGSMVVGSICHSSGTGINIGTSSFYTILNSIIHGCVTYNIFVTANSTGSIISNCTFMNWNNIGRGLHWSTTSYNKRVINSIFTGFEYGIYNVQVQRTRFEEWNDFYNNTTNIYFGGGAGLIGENSKTVDPQFANASVVTVTTATTSGSTLTKAGATFVTSGVTAGRDYVYISAGAGATAGIYGITSVDSETQLTLDIAPGNSAGDVTAQMIVGHNFTIGKGSLRASGYPGVFIGGYSKGYIDIGAIQTSPETAHTFS